MKSQIVFKFAVVLIFFVGSAGCMKGGLVDNNGNPINSENLNKLKNKLAKKPNDIGLNRELVLEYVRLDQKYGAESIATAVVEQSEKYLALNPNDTPLEFLYYDYKSRQAIKALDRNEVGKLRNIFDRNELVKQKGLIPPSAIDGLIRVERYKLLREVWDVNSVLKKKFKNAIKENPLYIYSYIALSKIYQKERRYDLAVGVLDRAKKIKPDNPQVYVQAAEVYINKAHDKKRIGCYLDDKQSLSKAISLYKKAVSLKKDDSELHQRLAYLFLWYKKVGLFKHEIKKAYELSKSNYSKTYYAESIMVDDVDKAYALLKEVMKSDSRNSKVPGVLKRYYFIKNNLKKALRMSKIENENSRVITASRIFMNYIIYKKSGKDKEAVKLLKKNEKRFNRHKLSSKKNYLLYKYYKDEISEREVLDEKYNACELADMYYYVALNNYVNNNLDKTKKYLRKAIDKGHPAYVAYNSSVHLLSEISK